MPERVALTIAGFDPSGGAGVLADLKTFAAHGLYGEACVTVLTVQSTQGVVATEAVRGEWIAATLAALAADNPFACIKIGALGSAEAVTAVAEFVATQRGVPVVLDPVLRSTSGAELLEEAAVERMVEELLPRVGWVTPNFAEAAALAGLPCGEGIDLAEVTKWVRRRCPENYFLLTGGDGETASDWLICAEEPLGRWIAGRKIATTAGHGTGCTLASALAASLAISPELGAVERVRECKRYVEGALEHARPVGKGAGPLNHFWRV